MPFRRALLFLCLCGLWQPTVGAQPTLQRDPQTDAGGRLSIPGGKLTPGMGDRVVTHDEATNTVVARRHVTAGDTCICMLPDGQLVLRKTGEVTPSDRPFEPISKDELIERLTSQFPGFKSKATRRYVYIYNTSEPFAVATSRILETMYPGVAAYAKRQGIETHNPETPLVVLMFRTPREFQAYRRMPEGIVAYYHQLSNYVVLYEESAMYRVKRELGLKQSISTIAHEGVHQILTNIGVQQRLSQWPMWLSEGLAEFFAPTSTDRRLTWKGAGKVNDLRMFELEQYIKGNAFSGRPGEMIDNTVSAERLTSTGYATAWALTHYLATNKRKIFDDYLREVSQLGPLEKAGRSNGRGTIPANLEAFRRHFGDDLVDLEKRLLGHLKKQPYNDPFAEYPHFVAIVAAPNGRRVQKQANVFHTEALAEKWSRELIDNLQPNQRSNAQAQIRKFANRSLAEEYARRWTGR